MPLQVSVLGIPFVQRPLTQDFGKALARYVTVFNCSDGMDVKATGRILAGLAQTGAWACLEELSRIPADVLSVVAAQIESLMQVGYLNFSSCFRMLRCHAASPVESVPL